MNELINKDSEWIIHFMGSLDRLLDTLEKAREFDPFGHAGFDPTGIIRLPP